MKTSRLRIEPLRARHAALLYDALLDPALYLYIPDEPPASLEALTQRFAHLEGGGRADERWLNWVMFLADGAAAGALQATLYPGHAAIAYSVMPRLWRQGLATEGVAWMLEELKAREGVERAEALIDTRNAASIGLVERLGFRRIETIRDAATVHGESSDEHRYALDLP